MPQRTGTKELGESECGEAQPYAFVPTELNNALNKGKNTMVLQYNEIEDNEITNTVDIENFQSRITKQTTYRDHAGDSEVKLTIVTLNQFGIQYDEIEIYASDLEPLTWLRGKYGVNVRLFNVKNVKTIFIDSIWHFSQGYEELTVYRHTGYINTKGIKIYLSGDETVNENGTVKDITSNLQKTLECYQLPAPPKKQKYKRKFAKDSLKILKISNNNPQLGALLLAIIARAPLNIISRTDFLCYVVGITGTKKSCIAAACLNYFGKDFTHDNLPAHWISTDNALERLTQIILDALLVIDDFKYQSSSKISDSNDKMDRIVRGSANGSVRQRLNEADTNKLSEPRSMVLSTGEVIPHGPGIDPSIYYRMVIICIQNGDIDDNVLTELQQLGKNGNLSKAMSGYIQYILKNTGKLDELYNRTFQKVRKSLRKKTNITNDRVIGNFASLIATIKVYLKFVLDQGAISADEASALFKKSNFLLMELASSQHDIISKANVLNIVNQAFEKSLQEGKCILRDADTNKIIPLRLSTSSKFSQLPKPETAGWVDKISGEIFISAEFDVSKIFDFIPPELSSYVDTRPKAFWIQMRENNCLKGWGKSTGRTRNNVRKIFHGKKHTVYHTRFSVKLPK